MTAPGRVVDRVCPGSCGRTDTRPYACGPRCPEHTPARLAGLPEPDIARYCAPRRCRCGQCPSYGRALESIRPTIVDTRAVASGKRRAPLGQYREAQAAIYGKPA